MSGDTSRQAGMNQQQPPHRLQAKLASWLLNPPCLSGVVVVVVTCRLCV